MIENMYTTDEYLEKNPTWHVEDSPWKARQILRIMARNRLMPRTICEVGCGAGEILRQLQEKMEQPCTLWGYEISPQAFALCQRRENESLHFKLADFLQEKDVFFDLILLIDVIEHLEDYCSFLREIKPRSQYKILHIPLEFTLSAVVRGSLINERRIFGHLHHFSQDIALQMLKDLDYQVLDYFYTPWILELPAKVTTSEIKRQLLLLPRKLSFALRKDLAVRLFGGWSLLVLIK